MYCNRSEESTPHCNRSVAVKTSLFGVVMNENPRIRNEQDSDTILKAIKAKLLQEEYAPTTNRSKSTEASQTGK